MESVALAAKQERSAAAVAPQARLLIVDDIEDNRNILARRFQRRGFEVTEADSGFRALELIARQSFDLVLLDVMMPDLDGLETLARIRSEHSASSLPVIMVTAKSQSEDIAHALEAGANDYVTKPVDLAVALARVNAQIARKRAEEAVRQANDALSRANEGLEHRVAERTAELVRANQQLRDEIAHRQQSEARAQYLARHDALSGLGNRVLLREQLELALADAKATGETLAVLLLDLDRFKSINDALGHSIGDALIKSVAGRLRDGLSNSDRVARLGGDEFAIIQLGEEQPRSAAALASRIVELVGRPYAIEGHQIVTAVSAGIALSAGDESDPDHLLKRADLAMYRAKAAGGGTFRFFEPEMDALAQARRSMELDMRTALMQGGFELFYQPVVCLRRNRVTGFEALLRWPHPERGFISPMEFVPLAEEIGLIVPLGEWVLRQACAEAATWPDDIKVAVNLSPIQFKNGSLVPLVVGALAASGLPASRLELEITESVLLDKTDSNLGTLNQLRDVGVSIALDDFGTGYSSLSYLRNFRFDKIKIDQSFVRDMSQRDDSRAIVRAVTGLGTSFGVRTNAEGVETEEQLGYLRMEGCSEVQGYLFSPPRPAREVPSLISRLSRVDETFPGKIRG